MCVKQGIINESICLKGAETDLILARTNVKSIYKKYF